MDTISRMVQQFMEMVRIDSESGEEESMMRYLEEYLPRETGAECRRDDYGNLVAYWAGKGSSAPPILLACHADTVKPGRGIEPILEGGVVRSKGDTILGADDKAGIAEVIEAIRTARVHPPIEFVVSRQEEVGLLGVKNLDYSLLQAREGFLMDSDVLDQVIIGGPSYITLDVDIHGRAAHAGMEPEKGISAIRAAALAILALPLGRIDEETTANVGTISGGLVRNGVPDRVTFAAECRSLNHDKAVDLAEQMEAAIVKHVEFLGARAEVRTNVLCEAVRIADDAPVVTTCIEALRTIGVEASPTMITGFTDASIYNNRGIPTAVLGIGARNEHSPDEHIPVDEMVKVVAVLHRIFEMKA